MGPSPAHHLGHHAVQGQVLEVGGGGGGGVLSRDEGLHNVSILHNPDDVLISSVGEHPGDVVVHHVDAQAVSRPLDLGDQVSDQLDIVDLRRMTLSLKVRTLYKMSPPTLT